MPSRGAGLSGLARALGSGTARPEGAAAHPPLPIAMQGPCPVPSRGLPATPQALFLTGLPRLRRGDTGGLSVPKSESNRLCRWSLQPAYPFLFGGGLALPVLPELPDSLETEMEYESYQPGEQIFRNGKADKRLTRIFEVREEGFKIQ